MHGLALIFLLAFLSVGNCGQSESEMSKPRVITLDIQGPITPASAAYFLRGMEKAQTSNAQLLLLRLDTPGGLDSSMRLIIQSILASTTPVAIYVSPSGSRAASAGTYMMYSSHIAAMAPGTNLGAATPVAISVAGDDKNKSESKEPTQDAMKAKMVHDAAAYIRSLAQLRGRNVEWAEKAVTNAESLSAQDAKAQNVIDYLADDTAQLLQQIDQQELLVGQRKITLNTAHAVVLVLPMNWQEQLLSFIANPNIALLLIMIGVYGLIFEFYVPGMIGPGVLGGICLLLGAYGLAMLPLNFVGVALIVLGLGLMVAESITPTLGVMGIGGVIAVVFGALMLVDADIPELRVSMSLIIPLAITSAAGMALTGIFAWRARHQATTSGAESMLEKTVFALDGFEREGYVQGFGENWQARSTQPLARGQAARVIAIDGLTLVVEPKGESS